MPQCLRGSADRHAVLNQLWLTSASLKFRHARWMLAGSSCQASILSDADQANGVHTSSLLVLASSTQAVCSATVQPQPSQLAGSTTKAAQSEFTPK